MSAPQRTAQGVGCAEGSVELTISVLPSIKLTFNNRRGHRSGYPLRFLHSVPHRRRWIGAEGDHSLTQEGRHRLRKSIIDGSELSRPRLEAGSPSARSTRVVLCRAASNGIPLPLLLYRVWKARSDVGCLLGGVPDQRGQGTEAAPTTRSWSPALRYR